MTAYAELAARSNFSFLEGASHPKELVLSAILRGHTGMGLADRNTLAGVVRAWSALRDFREEGWAPEKQREGGGPGEHVWVEDPAFAHIDREDVKARAKAFKLILGARLRFNDGTPDILAYPEDRQGWGRLCRLLTLGNGRAKKGQCEIGLRDLLRDLRKLAPMDEDNFNVLDTKQLADTMAGIFAGALDNPNVGLDHVTLKSPAAPMTL